MSELNEFVKESLPTNLSRWVASSTATITLACVFLPEFLQKIGLSAQWTEALSFRIASATTILSVGALFLLSIIIRYYRNERITAERWDKESSNYERLEVSFGVRVYSDKSQQQRIYDRVWLCPHCFEGKKEKMTLQLKSRRMPWEYVCSHCNTSLMVRPFDDPTPNPAVEGTLRNKAASRPSP